MQSALTSQASSSSQRGHVIIALFLQIILRNRWQLNYRNRWSLGSTPISPVSGSCLIRLSLDVERWTLTSMERKNTIRTVRCNFTRSASFFWVFRSVSVFDFSLFWYAMVFFFWLFLTFFPFSSFELLSWILQIGVVQIKRSNVVQRSTT